MMNLTRSCTVIFSLPRKQTGDSAGMTVTPPPHGAVTPWHIYWLDRMNRALISTWMIPGTSHKGHHASSVPLPELATPELGYGKQS